MKGAPFYLLMLVLTGFGPVSEAWAQTKDTYHFGKPEAEMRGKLPKTVSSRVHLVSGATLTVPLAYLDYNKIIAVENGVGKAYNPLEVSSFVMKQDSFVVLRDFKIADGKDEQDFRTAFVLVSVVGPGFILYQFNGTMRHDDAVKYNGGAAFNGTAWVGTSSRSTSNSTEYPITKVWFIKRDGDPRWMSLSNVGNGLRSVIEPIIADDKKLNRSIDWDYLDVGEVQKLLNKYITDKKAGL